MPSEAPIGRGGVQDDTAIMNTSNPLTFNHEKSDAKLSSLSEAEAFLNQKDSASDNTQRNSLDYS